MSPYGGHGPKGPARGPWANLVLEGTARSAKGVT